MVLESRSDGNADLCCFESLDNPLPGKCCIFKQVHAQPDNAVEQKSEETTTVFAVLVCTWRTAEYVLGKTTVDGSAEHNRSKQPSNAITCLSTENKTKFTRPKFILLYKTAANTTAS